MEEKTITEDSRKTKVSGSGQKTLAVKEKGTVTTKKKGEATVKPDGKVAVKTKKEVAVRASGQVAVKKRGAVVSTVQPPVPPQNAEEVVVKEKKASGAKKSASVKAEKKPAEEVKTKKKGRTAKASDAAKSDTVSAASSKKDSENAENTVKTTKNQVKHVLFAASEAWPFAGTGGLGEVVGSLPRALNKLGTVEARVILPLYENFPAEYREKLSFVRSVTVPLAWRNQYCGLFELEHEGVKFYFVDNEYYFKRSGLYGYGDDGERFAFFSRAVLELIPYLDWHVDILHCNDWHTALIPVYYKLFYQYRDSLQGIKTVFTIHNIEYQGQFSPDVIEDLFGIPRREYMSIEFGGCINLMKGAIDYSDSVSTVSKSYAGEIMSGEYAHGLQSILLKNAHKLKGILNGIDTDIYNPATNESLFKNYDADTVDEFKPENKTGLQRLLNLPAEENVPMIAMITRLASHKGIDIVRSAFNEIMKKGVQFVVLGTGEPDHENFFRHMQNVYGNRVRAIISFNKDLAQKIYAGADIFLMPSKSEPCGLSQMMAMRYGTVPIVRATGGLKDSVIDCGDGKSGNGFCFSGYDAGDLLYAVDRAVGLYRDYSDIFKGLRRRAMKYDFSWGRSAKEYDEYYNEVLG